jgi:hypothetical protein
MKAWWAIAALLVPAVAAGDDAAIDDPYPLQVSRRPLLLPSGTAEIQAQVRGAKFTGAVEFDDDFGGGESPDIDLGDLIYTDLGARAAVLPWLELYGGAAIVVEMPESMRSDSDTFDQVIAGARIALSRLSAVELHVLLDDPTSDFVTRMDSRLTIAKRKRLNASFTGEIRGGFRYDRLFFGETPRAFFDKPDGDVHALFTGGELRAIVQTETSKLGFELYFELYFPLAENFESDLDTDLDAATRFGARAVYTASDSFDLFIEFGTRDDGQPGSWTQYVAGASGRVF